MKGISVIIPTLNRTTFLLNTLKDLVVQKFDHPFEILIVDQSSKKDTIITDFCTDYSFINYQHITLFRGLPEARNYGASKATYDYLLYLDDDIECSSNLLEEHFLHISKPNVGVVAGGITEKFKKNTNTEVGKFKLLSATPVRGFHKKVKEEVDHAGGGNFSVKKEVFDQVGGIDENLTIGAALYEETDFCLRVKSKGYTTFFNYDAHMYHLAAETGGCRVEDINKYIFSLSRNRTIIIERYLPWYFKISAKAYLLKLVISYTIAYKKTAIFNSYLKGTLEGKVISNKGIKRTYFE